MGSLEILVILLIGFIVLGPQKMIEAARFLGDLVGQLRGVAKSIPHMDLDEISKISPKDNMNEKSPSSSVEFSQDLKQDLTNTENSNE
ncbi:MAG: twin-arginine translocase TatA/TatE family subunit [SAR202 cluster bacterium]|nr:twin-arginine translocase TatA/TatE family subunit [SAR202 cluster bacterium]